MLVGLIDCEYRKGKSFPNLALMKISAYYKSIGADVVWAVPFIEHYDKLYISKVFNWTPAPDLRQYNANEIHTGGTGYDIGGVLPEYIDSMQPDYSLYPNMKSKTAYGFLTRGCPNKCAWCVVPKKEGEPRPYMDIEQIAIDGRRRVVLMDNNILALRQYAIEQFKKIIRLGLVVDFNQAMDARLIDEEIAALLGRMSWIGNTIRLGCDTDKQIKECERAIALIRKHHEKIRFELYTMLHGDFEKCYNRVTYFRDDSRVVVNAQPFRDPYGVNTPPRWQKDLAYWCNRRWLYKTCDFRDFKPRKNFICSVYFRQ